MQLKGPLRNKQGQHVHTSLVSIKIKDARNQFHNNFAICLLTNPLWYIGVNLGATTQIQKVVKT